MAASEATTTSRFLYAVPTAGIALGLFGWQLLIGFDWFEIAFGYWAWLYWTMVLFWAGSAGFGVYRVRLGRFVALTAPLALLPAVGAVMLVIQCASGNCV